MPGVGVGGREAQPARDSRSGETERVVDGSRQGTTDLVRGAGVGDDVKWELTRMYSLSVFKTSRMFFTLHQVTCGAARCFAARRSSRTARSKIVQPAFGVVSSSRPAVSTGPRVQGISNDRGLVCVGLAAQ